jgi:hypothetical protein
MQTNVSDVLLFFKPSSTRHAVPLNYSAADLAADHATLERILARP